MVSSSTAQTGESFTNSSVEYFLIDNNNDNNNTGGSTTANNTREEIGSIHNAESERFCFVEDDYNDVNVTSFVADGNNRGRAVTRGTDTDIMMDEDDDEEEALLVISQVSSSRLQHPHMFLCQGRGRFQRQHANQAELNRLNYLNAITYLCNLFVSWGVGVWGLDHIVSTRWEITVEYETLVTPAEWASFYVLAVIMVWESVFTVAQLVPYYRARPIIQAGTRLFFFYTFLWQTAWTLLYSFRFCAFSFVAMVECNVNIPHILVALSTFSINRATVDCSIEWAHS
jgi:hypothetical protein